jgi:recombination protein RecT
MTQTANISQTAKDLLAQKANKETKPGKTLESLFEQMKPAIAQMLPKHITPERMLRIGLTAFRTNPKLRECTPQSMLAAMLQASQLGLEPNLLGHAYLIPFKNKGVMEVQFQIGYKGLIDLALRSGKVQSISAHEVCMNDEFHFEYGLNEDLKHIPALKDRGEVIAYYAYAKYKDGGHTFLVMSKEKVLEHAKKFSKSYFNGKFSGPWETDFDAMAKKTVLKQLLKNMPLSIEIQRAIETTDETVKTELSKDMTEIESIITYDYDQETGEVLDQQDNANTTEQN